MKKIKILYTINFIKKGGPSNVLLNIIKNIDRDKYDINILTIIDQNDISIINSLKSEGINIIEFKMKKKISDVFKYGKQVINEINKINPDIIHTHGIVTSILIATNKVKGYKITTIHNNIYEDYAHTYGKIKGNIIAYIHLNALKKFDQIICCSKTSYDVIKNKFKNISYIRNGIDMDYKKDKNIIRNKIRDELCIDNQEIVFVYVGVIIERKRVVELVKLFKENAEENETLLIIGEGDLLNKAKLYESERIRFLGFKDNVADYLAAADIYTSNSKSEGFSISIIEALEFGLPLLVSDIVSHKECFEIDKNYYIGEHFNMDTFKEKKRKIVNHINEKDKIKEFKNMYLSSKVMFKQYEEYYMKGVKENAKANN